MAPTASLMTPKACATKGSFMSATAATKVTARPIAACLSETAPRFSPNPHASASRARTPNADCNCSIDPPEAGAMVAAAHCKAHAARFRSGGGRTSDIDNRSDAVDHIDHDISRLGLAAQAAIFSAFSAHAKFLAVLQPGRRRCHWLADLRPDRQRVRPRDGGTGTVSSHGAAGFRGRPRRGPLRAQAGRADLPACPGAHGIISRMGRLFGLVDGIADFYRDRRARNCRRV